MSLKLFHIDDWLMPHDNPPVRPLVRSTLFGLATNSPTPCVRISHKINPSVVDNITPKMRVSFRIVVITIIAISCGTLCKAGTLSVPDICSVGPEAYRQTLNAKDNYNRIILNSAAVKNDMNQFNRVCYKKAPGTYFADSVQYLIREYLINGLRLADSFFEAALTELDNHFQGQYQSPEYLQAKAALLQADGERLKRASRFADANSRTDEALKLAAKRLSDDPTDSAMADIVRYATVGNGQDNGTEYHEYTAVVRDELPLLFKEANSPGTSSKTRIAGYTTWDSAFKGIEQIASEAGYQSPVMAPSKDSFRRAILVFIQAGRLHFRESEELYIIHVKRAERAGATRRTEPAIFDPLFDAANTYRLRFAENFVKHFLKMYDQEKPMEEMSRGMKEFLRNQGTSMVEARKEAISSHGVLTPYNDDAGLLAQQYMEESLLLATGSDWYMASQYYHVADDAYRFKYVAEARDTVDNKYCRISTASSPTTKRCLGNMRRKNFPRIDVSRLGFAWRLEYAFQQDDFQQRRMTLIQELLKHNGHDEVKLTDDMILTGLADKELSDVREECEKYRDAAEVLAEALEWDRAIQILKVHGCAREKRYHLTGDSAEEQYIHDHLNFSRLLTPLMKARLIGAFASGISTRNNLSPGDIDSVRKVVTFIKNSEDDMKNSVEMKAAAISLNLHLGELTSNSQKSVFIYKDEAECHLEDGFEKAFTRAVGRAKVLLNDIASKLHINLHDIAPLNAANISNIMDNAEGYYIHALPLIEQIYRSRLEEPSPPYYMRAYLLHQYYKLRGDYWAAHYWLREAFMARESIGEKDCQDGLDFLAAKISNTWYPLKESNALDKRLEELKSFKSSQPKESFEPYPLRGRVKATEADRKTLDRWAGERYA